ncbi:bifunctional (p)ppGpp synthetase/guanosine-3',5'-bis(diphosphate) 3'-pyrophosphohydrolase [Actibacterium sp. 188UL27-1]|uniref:RelA/SpoT family protein n=1 Tax=Actibacterium sp. 188UL27-1 TaxID=2786961 RepID=UPI00195F02A1|nr:bifunctional (p)ppGpp synthetase/guanosine-3',5'-bis(diphosphate) 3'-pyrophosphohydrolase [Actibacterium sp. 188UL27-1]MBM7067096.1 bifunctional (p)ppGpp synthetase/guanosine-3',5'-bis(diphosphate) 3'-pyrophosphohydrolase [Actibacterium sp. 188UL27-1]
MLQEVALSADDLIGLVAAYNPKTDADRIRAAYEFGASMHDGQFRHSGEPYFTHPVTVAALLTEQRLDDATIITALLHDTIEDTKANFADISRQFGREIAELVDGVTKLTNLQLSSTETKQAENFRKLFIAMSRDMRVILVKLADRLHNMRTIKYQRPEKQVQKSRETMDIYAPLAGRMGMQWMRDELEDLSFQVLNSDRRNSIMRRFVTLRKESGDVIEKITTDLKLELKKAHISAQVSGRAKRPYSIWRKMEQKGQGFSRLADIYGFRIITENREDCYRVLGAIHARWTAVPGRFKDYISQPKSNGYRSIHTTVSGRDGKLVEMQIRTREMNDVAESGVAAHWSYRDGVRSENPFAVDPANWLKSLTERFDEADHDEFLEHVKLEMYSDQVFCFTPKGDVIKLPRGATPIDYAYGIHTSIGDRCVGAKVDGLRVPLWTRLKNGQSVEIITAEGQRPQSTWLDIATTGRAKQAIRRSLRAEDRERFIKLGRELARVAFEHMGKDATPKALATAARRLGLSDRDELLAQLGSAELAARDVVSALYPNLVTSPAVEEITRDRAVLGLASDQTSTRANCCKPIPGERIVGITYRGKGVVVHAIDCPVLVEVEDQPDRWVDLHWHAGPHAPAYDVTLELTISNDAGVLGRICTLIGEQKANISDLNFIDRKPDFYRLRIDLHLRDVEHLHMVMTALEAESNVAALHRFRDMARKPS